MSRQYDEAHGDDIVINGETLSTIEPTTFEELLDAVKMKDKLAYAANTFPNDEDSSSVYALLEEQEGYIRDYIDNLGSFDNSILVANIDYLCRKYGIRVGELERYAGISAGYISRTAKENSLKKMSIDVVWKIAKLFNVSVQDLIGNRLEEVKGNVALILKFLDKAIKDTEERSLDWTWAGGVATMLDESLIEMGLVTDEEPVCVYHPDHLSQGIKWVLAEDIARCRNFVDDDDLLIIPFRWDGKEDINYDFIIEHKEEYVNGHMVSPKTWEKVFYTADDPFQRLNEKAAELYDRVRDTEFDAQITPNIRDMMKAYLM